MKQFADSMGMNEQDLPNRHSLLRHGNVSLVSDVHPRVATVLDQMRDVMRALNEAPSADEPARRTLTRVHVHTLAFQTRVY